MATWHGEPYPGFFDAMARQEAEAMSSKKVNADATHYGLYRVPSEAYSDMPTAADYGKTTELGAPIIPLMCVHGEWPSNICVKCVGDAGGYKLCNTSDPLEQRTATETNAPSECRHSALDPLDCRKCRRTSIAPGGIVNPLKEYDALVAALQPHMLSGEDAVSCVRRLVSDGIVGNSARGLLEELREIIGSGGGSITEAALRLKAHSMLPSAAAARPAIRGISAGSRYFRRSKAEEWSDYD